MIPSYRGKVRDIYDLGDRLIIVASDRISAFDVVFQELVPEKGAILTRISNAWFSFFKTIPNHLLEIDLNRFPEPFQNKEDWRDKAVLVKKAERINFECVVRGYLSGSGWKEYKKNGMIGGLKLPKDLKESEILPEPIFTPARKNDLGHDENVNESTMEKEIGKDLFQKLKRTSLYLYNEASKKVSNVGLILCDTKFEFGIWNEEVILIDEILTPDSSRYWEQSQYKLGISPPSYDKQLLRNWIESTNWDKNPPPIALPESLLLELKNKYIELEGKLNQCLLQK